MAKQHFNIPVIVLLFAGFGFFTEVSLAQTQNSSLQKVALINEISDLFNNSFRAAEKTGCSISLKGKVAEWDSLSQYAIHYQLHEIDWQNAEIIVESREMAMIAASCIGQQHCIAGIGAKNKKHFYSNASFFAMPVSELKKLEIILSNLIRLKEIENKKF
jgi:hypothetical protein